MKKKITAKQVMAIICIILLAGMYISTLVFAIIGGPLSTRLLKAAILSTIIIPIVAYFLMMFYRLTHKNDENYKYDNNDGSIQDPETEQSEDEDR